MEYWDLYDKDRKPIGKKHLRGSEFEDGEYYICCEIWVMNDKGEFLITKRHPDKKAGNLWEFVGGGTLAGENTKQSSVRELFEETGIMITEADLSLLTTYQNRNYFQDIYIVKQNVDIKDMVLQPEETVDVRWVDDPEIVSMIENGQLVRSVAYRYDLFKRMIN